MEQYPEIRILQDVHRREKRNLAKRLKEVETDRRALKIKTSKMRKDIEARMRIEEELRKELEAVKLSNIRLKQQLEFERNANREQEGILRTRNEELEQELEALKARLPMDNLQLASSRSGPQGQTETTGINAQPKVSIDSFQPIRILGNGGFGQVILVKKKASDGSDQHFALKVMKKAHIVNCCRVTYTVTEKEALVLASGHPFITTLYSCFQTKEHLFFVLDYESGGNLAKELAKVPVFSEETAQFYAAEITLALEFLHRHGILHGDLKLDNVLIDGDGHCKVADFGMSELGIFDGDKIETSGGTPCYMAPEMCAGQPCGQEVDWWALGIMMYAMMAGMFPFNDSEEWGLQFKIRCHEVMYPIWISEEAKLIMRMFLTKDPNKRLGAYGQCDRVREQQFFRGIDWCALQEKRVKPPHKPNVMTETEENLSFDELLKPDNGTYRINQEEFECFSFVNHGVPQ